MRGHIPGSAPGWDGTVEGGVGLEEFEGPFPPIPSHDLTQNHSSWETSQTHPPLSVPSIYYKSMIFWEQLLISACSGLAELQILLDSAHPVGESHSDLCSSPAPGSAQGRAGQLPAGSQTHPQGSTKDHKHFQSEMCLPLALPSTGEFPATASSDCCTTINIEHPPEITARVWNAPRNAQDINIYGA